jgi:glutamate-1-semialdehyde 2,1-aminomutase
LSGNPLATAAGLAALDVLTDDDIVELSARARRLGSGLRDAIGAAGIAVQVPVLGTLVGLRFAASPATDYATASETDEATYAGFFHAMLDLGVALAPGAYEVLFPGLAHTDEVIDEIVDAAAQAAVLVAATRR